MCPNIRHKKPPLDGVVPLSTELLRSSRECATDAWSSQDAGMEFSCSLDYQCRVAKIQLLISRNFSSAEYLCESNAPTDKAEMV